ncbi:hypothetical protein [Candidatus Synchoanobacter obligatus]|uniref:Uncharacterized protein n=1 Tax=Candidatus Synchoanobacter obligatus TaxID=2919597 RepID=A0ABT1L4X9_9GAMM|nr:hypothetical protein [Candidatus Synchoanobacter obligatus]MCP8352011.1 hypothetical protein [Candidatus Synchoanobacter obligatus]
MKHAYHSLLAATALISPLSSAKAFSFKVNVGIGDVNQETKALYAMAYDDMKAIELISVYKSSPERLNKYPTYNNDEKTINIMASDVYIVDSNPSSEARSDIYFIPYNQETVEVSSNDVEQRTLLIDRSGTSTNASAYETGEIEIKSSENFTFVPPADATTYSAVNGTTSDYAIILTTAQYDALVTLKDDLLKTVQAQGKHTYAYHEFTDLHSGLYVEYDYQVLTLFASLTGHYPLPADIRESNPLVTFLPKANFDASIGAAIDYKSGKIGAAFGLSHLRGTLSMHKEQLGDVVAPHINYKRSYMQSEDNAANNTSGTTYEVDEALYFAEISASTNLQRVDGLSIFGKYRVGMSMTENDTNANNTSNTTKDYLSHRQDSISIGSHFVIM